PEGSGGRNLENDCGSARRPRRSHFTLKPRTRLPVFLHSSKLPLSDDRMRTFGLSEKSQGSRSTVVCRSYSGSLPTKKRLPSRSLTITRALDLGLMDPRNLIASPANPN